MKDSVPNELRKSLRQGRVDVMAPSPEGFQVQPGSPSSSKRRLGIVALMIVLWPCVALAGSPHTPQPGSAERKQICDGMRQFVRAERAPKAVVFKIEQLKVLGSYCFFEGFALYADGSRVPESILPDVVYNTFLKRGKGGWRVIHDLTRTDVPSESEIRELRRDFPSEIPRDLIPPFWRDLLKL